MIRAARRSSGIAALVAALAVTGAFVSGSGGQVATAEMAALSMLADSLDRRLVSLEREIAMAGSARAPAASVRERYEQLRAREAAAAAAVKSWLRFVPSGIPVDGGVVSSAFGPARYHPIQRQVKPHVGVDIDGAEGAPVRATADGVVFAVAENPTYGRAVDVVHGSSGYITRVAHLRAIAVRPGQAVRRGELLGYVGHTGLATGSHCHYEVFFRGRRRDPLDYLGSVPVADSTRSQVD